MYLMIYVKTFLDWIVSFEIRKLADCMFYEMIATAGDCVDKNFVVNYFLLDIGNYLVVFD